VSAFGGAVVAAARLRGSILQARARTPRTAQERVLRALVTRARATSFGRAHDFVHVHSARDFCDRVPLRRYADLAPWLDRALVGEPDVIWPGRIPYFAWSSGTTGGIKYLPISHDAVAQQRRGGFEPIATYLRATGDRSLFAGPSILLGGTTALERRDHGIRVGTNTGIMALNMPWFVRHQQRPTPRVAVLTSWDEKISAIARASVHEDVRMVAGCPSWFPAFFDRVLQIARVRTVREVWPNLRLLTGGGIHYAPYRSVIEAKVGARIPYVETYNATEGGILGVHDGLHDEDMLLLPDSGVFYELVPVAELDLPRPTRLPLWEAIVGEVYALVVSTSSGLFGYVIGDCIRFTGAFPHRFVFEGRVGGFLNLAGELLSQGEIDRAVARACTLHETSLTDFTVGADLDHGGAARHVFFLEATCASPQRLASTIDADLAAQNGDYAAHRSVDDSLKPPVVRIVPAGTFHTWMRERGQLGGQHKVPRLLDATMRASFEAVARGAAS
jgi:hypothetical protein